LAGQDIRLVLRVRDNVIDGASVLSQPGEPQIDRLKNLGSSLRTLNQNFRYTLYDVLAGF
jgi:hypothetical protein